MVSIPVWQFSKALVDSWLHNSVKWLILIGAMLILLCIWWGTLSGKLIASFIIVGVTIGALTSDINGTTT